jgi:hypothetical protein
MRGEAKGRGKAKAKSSKAASVSAIKGAMALGTPAQTPHPMTAEQDRFEDEDEPFDDGVH